MSLVIEWVTQIIIFILLAAIIDLLIPDTSMKKYIKLVVGLILILIFLKPLFYLFKVDIPHALERSYNQLYVEENNSSSIENLIKIQKTDIQASRDAYILEQMTFQLIQIAEEPLIEEFQVEIYDIDYLFKHGQDVDFDSLEEIIVYLRMSDKRSGVINTIEEVIINTDEKAEIRTERENEEGIIRLLQQQWELGDKKLILKWGGGTS